MANGRFDRTNDKVLRGSDYTVRGIGVFALSSVARDMSLGMRSKSIIPFSMEDLVRMALIFSFPALALWLPSLMS